MPWINVWSNLNKKYLQMESIWCLVFETFSQAQSNRNFKVHPWLSYSEINMQVFKAQETLINYKKAL